MEKCSDRAAQQKYSDVELDFLFVDNAAMQMVLNPAQFDVILTGNLFGDIISDEASVIGGSIGLLASASIGDRYALFEPIHGSFPQGKGKGIANPIATILSAAMMLDHFDMAQEANAIRDAVQKTINSDIGTPDINPIKVPQQQRLDRISATSFLHKKGAKIAP